MLIDPRDTDTQEMRNALPFHLERPLDRLLTNHTYPQHYYEMCVPEWITIYDFLEDHVNDPAISIRNHTGEALCS